MAYRNTERRRKKQRAYYQKNRDKILKRVKEYQEKNKEKILQKDRERSKRYYQENKEKIRNKQRRYKQENYNNPKFRNKIKQYNKRYRKSEEGKKKRRKQNRRYKERYRGKEKAYQRDYRNKRRKIDKEFLVKYKLRSRLKDALNLYTKTGKIMLSKDYGIDYGAIIEHLKPFPEDLNNYQIHHIKPLFTFNFVNPDGSQNLEAIKEAFKPENHKWVTIEKHKEIHKRLRNNNHTQSLNRLEK